MKENCYKSSLSKNNFISHNYLKKILFLIIIIFSHYVLRNFTKFLLIDNFYIKKMIIIERPTDIRLLILSGNKMTKEID